MKGETGGARCRGFKAEPEEEEEEGRGWSQAGNRCCKGRNTSFWSSPPTNMFQQRITPASQVKNALEKGCACASSVVAPAASLLCCLSPDVF